MLNLPGGVHAACYMLTHVSRALQARLHLAEGDGAIALQSLAHLMARVQQAAPHTEQHTEAQQHALRLQESDVSVFQSLQLSFTVWGRCVTALQHHLPRCQTGYSSVQAQGLVDGGHMLFTGLHAVRKASRMTCTGRSVIGRQLLYICCTVDAVAGCGRPKLD